MDKKVILITVICSIVLAAGIFTLCGIAASKNNNSKGNIKNSEYGGVQSNVGSNTPKDENVSNNQENKVLKIGDTIVGDDYEITVKRVICGRNLNIYTNSDDYLMEDGNYPLKIDGADGNKYEKSYVAKDGRAYVCVEYILKYKGKSDMTYVQAMSIDFDNGYEFKDHPYLNAELSCKIDDKFQDKYVLDLEPLCDDYIVHTVFDVPEQVMSDHDKPLKIKCNLQINGKDQQLQYQVR